MPHRKILAILIAMLIMLHPVAFVCADESIVVNNLTRKVTITGDTVQFPGTVVTVSIWYPNKSAPGPQNTAALDSLCAYIVETTVLSDKTYSVEFYLKENDPSGKYTVKVFVPGDSEPKSYDMNYCNEVRANAVLTETQKTPANSSAIKAILDKNAVDVDVEAGMVYMAYGEDDKRYVANYIAENQPANMDDLKQTLLKAEEKIGTVKKLQTASRAEIEEIIFTKTELLLIKAEDITAYDNLNDTQKEEFLVLMDVALTDCKYPEDVSKAFTEAVLQAATVKEESGSSGGSGGGGGGGSKKSHSIAASAGWLDVTPQIEEGKNKFSDLNNVLWAKNAINILADRDIINGKGDNKFCPADELKREELAKIIATAFPLKTASEKAVPFDDVLFEAWYYKSVSTLYNLSIINGISADAFGVGAPITRQDMMVMLYKTLKYLDYNIEPIREVKVFNDDSQISDYAKEAINNMYAAGIVNGKNENVLEPQGTATRAEVAKVLYEILFRLNLL